MSTLQLKATADRPEVLTGESIPVTVTAHNSGSVPVPAPDPDRTFAFDVVLRSLAHPGYGYTLSSAAAASSRFVDDSPLPFRTSTVMLDPGDTRTYHVDIASLTLEPIRPGKYNLAAGIDLEGYVESPESPLSVGPPHVLALASAFSPAGLNEVFIHQDSTGHTFVMQRDGRIKAPADGPSFRRAPGAPSPIEVSAAIVLGRPNGTWWYGWLSGDAFSAGVAQLATVFKNVGPQPLGLTHCSLNPEGWQPDTKQAYFIALGLNPTGEATAALIHAEAKGVITVRAVPLGVPGMPSHWSASYDAAAHRITLAGVSERANISRVWTRSIDFESGQPDPLRALTDLSGPAVALALSPETVDVLSGSHQMKLQRLPLLGGPAAAEWPLDPPMNTSNRLPTTWALGPNRFNNPPVLAYMDGKILIRRAREAGWTVLTGGDIDPQFIRILDNGEDTLYAVWVDRIEGIQYRSIGAPNQLPPPEAGRREGNIF